MKGFLGFAALLLVINDASAHYIFNQLTAGGTKHAVYKYIRQNTNYNSPATDLSSPDLRCNVGGASGASTETVSVRAGDSLTFSLDTPVYHQGPVSVYLSRAPGGSAASYDGSGGWFKIYDWGPSFSGGSASWTLSGSYTFTLPTCIPDGEYLVRIQSLGIHNPWPAGTPQFYVSCAQVKVTGGGNASPPTVSIPGAFKDSDPGYTVNIYNNFNSYTVPGPAVWTCGSSDGGGTPTQPTTTLVTSIRTSTSADPTTAPTTPSGCSTAKYGQCGGIGFTGCSSCTSGSTCSKINDYYSQCT